MVRFLHELYFIWLTMAPCCLRTVPLHLCSPLSARTRESLRRPHPTPVGGVVRPLLKSSLELSAFGWAAMCLYSEDGM
ncbi:hypothetical protein FB451DRAFT_1312597 [Mycena latifolia]|nr:hypothetical protein FB451DRAFT_1312597 [Mycena latifolia]